jgi:ribonucleoside-diphosphate reductase alpha chain
MNAASDSIVKYAANKAGIGLNLGRIRALKSPIRNGDAFHTGIIPFIQYFQASLKSCSQGGVRGSAGTFAYPIWHYEFPELIVLKNNKGTEETRARKVDYSVQLNELFYRRMLTGGDITLFSPHDVPDLLAAFYSKDIEKFTRLYEKYEADSTIRKRVFSASEIFTMLMTERVETGRIYIQNMDNTNSHTPFNTDLTPLTMSNLCQEITLPTVPMEYPGDPNGEIALCILGAINWGKVATHSQMEENCDILVRFLDSLIDIQSYPVEAAKTSTMKFRSLGIGVTNLAYSLAKQNAKYGSPESLKYCYEMMEAQQYFCMKTSVELAKEFGAPVGSSMTSRGNGVMPAFTQKKEAYDMLKESGYEARPTMDWDSLSDMILQYGIRNATLTAIMPVESSSVIIGATNGVEPPRSLVATKMNKELVVKQPVPGLRSVGKGYELLWDVDALEYLKVMATLQLWNDQSISTNASYVPSNYDGDEIPFQVLMKHLILWWKWGGKTLYYHNTKDDSGEVESGDECVGCKL